MLHWTAITEPRALSCASKPSPVCRFVLLVLQTQELRICSRNSPAQRSAPEVLERQAESKSRHRPTRTTRRSEQAVSSHPEVLERRCLYQPSGAVSRVSSHCEANGPRTRLDWRPDSLCGVCRPQRREQRAVFQGAGRWNVIHGWRVAAPENDCSLGVNVSSKAAQPATAWCW